MRPLGPADKMLRPASVGRRFFDADVPLAGEVQRVTRRGQIFAPQPHARLEPTAQSLVVADVIPHAVSRGIEAGEKGRARWAAVRRWAERVCEGHTFGSKAIQVGRNRGVFRQRGVRPLVIGHDDEDVGLGQLTLQIHRGSLPDNPCHARCLAPNSCLPSIRSTH